MGCRSCQKNFAPLLLMLGLSGDRRTDRLTLDLAELASQMSFARAARVDRKLAGTSATPGQAHHALADVAGMLTGGPDGVTGTGHQAPEVVLFDGTGVQEERHRRQPRDRADWALGTTRTSPSPLPPARVHRRRGLVDARRPARAPARPHLVVVDGEGAITALAQSLWPNAAIQRCWWYLPHGLRKACYAHDAADRHVSSPCARRLADQLGELPREQIRHQHDTETAAGAYDAFTATVPAKLTSTHAYLAATRPDTFTCLDSALRPALARLGGPELGTGVLERLMREINVRTDIGGSRWSIAELRDLLTVTTARLLGHPSWKAVTRSIHQPSTPPIRSTQVPRSVILTKLLGRRRRAL